MPQDDALTAYKAALADARMLSTLVLRSRERRERRRVEAAGRPTHAALAGLAGLRVELRARGVVPPPVRYPPVPSYGPQP
jgi:hypothetical protein